MASSIVWAFGFFFLVWVATVVQASHNVFREFQTLSISQPDQLYRTAYHFQPPKHWINDPNGPMIYKGLYHLFYQYNPKGSVWGNIVWAHSFSTDLINWSPLDPAIYPSKPFDINGCWSGSATILPGNKPAILYTGIDPKNQQVQNIAFPKNLSDPYLREWVKPDYNPVMYPTPTNAINSSSFRDPTTAWKGQDGVWRVLVGSKKRKRGIAILYKSRDFKHWVKAHHPLHSSRGTGMWECPDFFPVSIEGKQGVDTSLVGDSVKHVLKLSLDDLKIDYYTVGRYLYEKDKYVPDKTSADDGSGLRYDYGKFYASKTFFDDYKKRRVLWGWINESDSVSDDISKGWAGVQAIPRTVWLDSSGRQLNQWPVEEVQTLRTKPVYLENIELKSGSNVEVPGVKATQADVEVTFDVGNLENAEVMDSSWVNPRLLCSQKGASVNGVVGPFGLWVLASKNLDEYTSVFFRIFKSDSHDKHVVLMCSDQSRSSMRTELDKTTYGGFVDVDISSGKLSLRSLIDHSIVESFGGEGRTCITARVYPELAVGYEAHLHVFNHGSQDVKITKLAAWTMEKAQIA